MKRPTGTGGEEPIFIGRGREMRIEKKMGRVREVVRQYQDILSRVYAEQKRIGAIVEGFQSAPMEQWDQDRDPYALYSADLRTLSEIEEKAMKVIVDGLDHLDHLNEVWLSTVEESDLLVEINSLRREIEEVERQAKDRE